MSTDMLDAEHRTGEIKIHSAEDFEGMRRAGRLVAECLDMLTPHVVPGAVTDKLDKLAREFTLDHGGLPACLNYRGYTKTLCISPNHVVCHGIPSEKTLKDVVDYYVGGGNSNPYLDKEIHPLTLTGQERSDLVAFLESLTGEPPPQALPSTN